MTTEGNSSPQPTTSILLSADIIESPAHFLYPLYVRTLLNRLTLLPQYSSFPLHPTIRAKTFVCTLFDLTELENLCSQDPTFKVIGFRINDLYRVYLFIDLLGRSIPSLSTPSLFI
jgi:hypothetical protein